MRLSLTRQQRMTTVASISPWHVSSQVSAVAKSWWRPSVRLPASQPLPQTVEQLNAWRPDVLIAYASMAGILAEEQFAGRLHIRASCPMSGYTTSPPHTRAPPPALLDQSGQAAFSIRALVLGFSQSSALPQRNLKRRRYARARIEKA